MAKYARLIDRVVDVIYIDHADEDMIEVPDGVFGGFVMNMDGSFSPPSMPVEDRRTERAREVEDLTRLQIVSGFTSDALGAIHTYPSSLTDQQNLAANVLSSIMPGNAGNWTTMQMCEDADGVWSYRPHTAAQIIAVGVSGKARIMACLLHGGALRAQIEASDAPGSINIAAGWPG